MAVSFLTGCLVRGSVYPAPSVCVPSPPPGGLEEVNLGLTGGNRAVCWAYHDSSVPGSAPAVLYLHGNGENLETMRLSGTFENLAGMKVHVCALDYPGYGLSTGVPSQQSIADACERALGWIKQRYPHSRIVVCGWSLGAAAAIQAAAANRPVVDGLVVISGWTSLIDVASRFYPRFLVRMLVGDTYRSLDTIASIRCPVLVVHGKHDSLIPVGQGEKLAAATPGLQHFLVIENASHNDVLGDRVVWAAIRRFILSLPPVADVKQAAGAGGA